MNGKGIRVVVKRPVQVMQTMLDVFCDGSTLSLEGDLSNCDLREIWILSHTYKPERIVLPIEAETLDRLKRQLIPNAGLRHRVWHVLIEKGGDLVFASYDNFHPDCVWVSDSFPQEVIRSLADQRLIEIIKE